MLKTLFGDLGPRAVGTGYAPTEVAFAATAVLEEAAPAALPREHDEFLRSKAPPLRIERFNMSSVSEAS